MTDEPFETDLADMSTTSLASMGEAHPELAGAVDQVVETTSKPGRRISGYNPQRIDDPEE